MLKRIPVADLEIGMFVHKVEGRWFDHPFWRSQFLVEDTGRLSAIKESRVRSVVIDTDKGIDVSECKPAAKHDIPKDGPTPDGSRVRAIKRRAAMQLDNPQPVSMEEEVKAAAQIAEQARVRLGKVFNDARLGKALDVRKVEPVVSDILASVRRSPHAFSGLMRCKLKNEQIFRHALSVSALMVALADRMKLNGVEIHNSGLAGLLLDIGVNYLPNTVDPWTGGRRQADQRIWQSHVLLGYRALQNEDLPEAVLNACLMHHERIDGSGFPQGRAGKDIPQIARMAAICDSFEFLLSGTMGQPALDPAAAVVGLRSQVGAYDEDVLRLFIETIGLYPVGSFVELASGKLAMVIDEDRKDPLRPVVQAFYSLVRRERIIPHRIALADHGSDERILGIADLTGLELPADTLLRELVFLSAFRTPTATGGKAAEHARTK